MELCEANYFQSEAQRHYMSASQIKGFLNCEAAMTAELTGSYQREETSALLIGSYVDAHFAGTLPQFMETHTQIYTNKGTLRAEYAQANDIIARIESDRLMSLMLKGRQQVIVTGEIAGVPFRGKLDSLLDADQCAWITSEFPDMADHLLMANGAIVDLKIVRDFEPIWKPGAGRVSFLEYWNWPIQLAIYQSLVGGKLPCFLACATKQSEIDMSLIHLPQYMIDVAHESIVSLIPRYQAIKLGEIEPTRCEHCAYCRQSRVITGAVEADELYDADSN